MTRTNLYGGKISLWWLPFAAVLAAALITWAGIVMFGVGDGAVGNRMPDYSSYTHTGTASMGALPCVAAMHSYEMEVWVNEQRENRYVVVWKLDGKVLAVVFVNDEGYIYFLDSDFDGRWNVMGGGQPGDGRASDFYAEVEGCEDLVNLP